MRTISFSIVVDFKFLNGSEKYSMKWPTEIIESELRKEMSQISSNVVF